MNKLGTYRRFILLTLVALLPVMAMVALYIVRDPYHVVHRYSGCAYHEGDTLALSVNAGYVAIEALKYYDPEHLHTAFILGSSMSQNYKAAVWQQQLGIEEMPFHLDASCETIEGIVNKLRYLRNNGWNPRHLLIVMEEELLHRRPDEDNLLFVQHYEVAPEVSRWHFHEVFFNAMRNPATLGFMVAPQRYAARMLAQRYATTDIPDRFEAINECYYGRTDSLIAVGGYFTPAMIDKRVYHVLPDPQPLGTEGYNASWLETLARELNTIDDYTIIVPPRYLRPELQPHDKAQMERLFGREHVFDFTHVRALTHDQECYYDEAAHLISARCTELLDSVYSLKRHDNDQGNLFGRWLFLGN